MLAGTSGLDLVPDPGLHLTVQGVGFVGSVSRGELEGIASKARLELSSLAPFTLGFAAAEVVSEGVVMSAGPVQPVARLRLLLRNAIAGVLGRDRLAGPDGEPVWPHMSLAYANAPTPAGPLRRELRNAGFHSASSCFDRVSLIELRREGHLYAWDQMAVIGFAGSTGPPLCSPVGACGRTTSTQATGAIR